jgi:glycosyltransferase involved in cell wall biosynthesis
VSDLPVLHEHLRHERDCLMVPVERAEPLAQALVRAMGDADLRARLAAAGRETAARYTWGACAEAHERVYGRVHGGA